MAIDRKNLAEWAKSGNNRPKKNSNPKKQENHWDEDEDAEHDDELDEEEDDDNEDSDPPDADDPEDDEGDGDDDYDDQDDDDYYEDDEEFDDDEEDPDLDDDDDWDGEEEMEEEPSAELHEDDVGLFANKLRAGKIKRNNPELLAQKEGHPRAKKLAAAKRDDDMGLQGIVTKKEFSSHAKEASKAGAKDPQAYAASVLRYKLGLKKPG